jgi:hypothetical protein
MSEDVFYSKIHEIQSNASTEQAFTKRFFMWANAFFIFRFLNESHKSFFTKIPIHTAATLFLETPNNYSVIDILNHLRTKQQSK